MKVLLTGATGFTGSHVAPLLLKCGIQVRALARPTSDKRAVPQPDIEWVYGDVNDSPSLERALQGIDALVNVVSMGAGRGPLIVDAAVAAGIKRAVFISTTSLFTHLNASSKSLRIAAEESVKQSGINYTILRPTMIYGSSGDRNMCRLVRYIHRYPILPIFGSGKFLQQPVYVGDVAQAIVDCLLNDNTIKKSYNIPSEQPLSYNEVIDTVCRLTRRYVLKLHLPVPPIVTTLSLVERISIPLPLKAEQIMRLNEDKNFNYDDAARDFGYKPLSFAEGMYLELQEMGLRG